MAPSPTTSTSWSPPACCRSCGPAASGRSTSATTGARRAPSRSISRRPASWRSSATFSPRPTSSASRRSNQGPTPRCATPASLPSRAEEFAARLDALSHEFIALPRDGDLEFGLLITPVPDHPAQRAMTARRHAHRAAPRPAVLQAVLGQRRVEPRRWRRHHRLSLVGVGGHARPVARRPRHGRPTAAVARVHTPRRRDHRSRRPPQGDGRDGPVPVRAHARRRLRRARQAGRSARPGRRRLGHRHPDRPLPGRAAGDVAARHGGGAARQLGPDDPARHRRQEPAREGQRPDVERGERRQPVHRATARIAAARGRVRAAVLPRRGVVLRGRRARVPDPGLVPGRRSRHPRTQAMAHRARRGLPLAVGAQPAATDGDHPRDHERGDR